MKERKNTNLLFSLLLKYIYRYCAADKLCNSFFPRSVSIKTHLTYVFSLFSCGNQNKKDEEKEQESILENHMKHIMTMRQAVAAQWQQHQQ